MSYAVAACYSLQPLSPSRQQQLQERLRVWPAGEPALCGTILVAPDGLNINLAASPETAHSLLDWLSEQVELSSIKWSQCCEPPFRFWRVVLKRETITSGGLPPGALHDTTHLSPQEWHEHLQKAGVQLLDVRNDYEIGVGKFQGAIDPKTQKFTEFAERLPQLGLDPERPLYTYCTGGIRCEKAVPFLQKMGFAEVYQLEGGILNYLEHYPEGHFEGECFVFDERVALTAQLQPTQNFRRCGQCGQPYPEQSPCHP